MPTSKFAVLNFLTYAKHFQECPPASKSYINNNSFSDTWSVLRDAMKISVGEEKDTKLP